MFLSHDSGYTGTRGFGQASELSSNIRASEAEALHPLAHQLEALLLPHPHPTFPVITQYPAPESLPASIVHEETQDSECSPAYRKPSRPNRAYLLQYAWQVQFPPHESAGGLDPFLSNTIGRDHQSG